MFDVNSSFTFTEQLEIITKLSHLYPNLVKVWVFHVMSILVNSPELIQKVFNSEVCMEKPYVSVN